MNNILSSLHEIQSTLENSVPEIAEDKPDHFVCHLDKVSCFFTFLLVSALCPFSILLLYDVSVTMARIPFVYIDVAIHRFFYDLLMTIFHEI